MDANWKHCLSLIRKEEGGNDDDPHDRGGRTSRGIIQREYDAYRRFKKQPVKDVWKADDAEIDEIYQISYWQPWCPKMPSGIDLCLFDMNVNAGPIRSTKILQRALGVRDDGHIGAVTLNAIAQANLKILIPSFAIERRKFYRSLRDFRYFGKGWLARTDRIERAAMAMLDPGRKPESRIADDSQSA
jgi:lysozyme family protein